VSARIASCSCGAFTATCTGEPLRISVCHCRNCQRRTGSVFSASACFPVEAVQLSGKSQTWVRVAENGNAATFHFCPTCGSTLCWLPYAYPDRIYIATGAFGDPTFPAPKVEVYTESRHPWVSIDCPESYA
jgi:hypothetical protein